MRKSVLLLTWFLILIVVSGCVSRENSKSNAVKSVKIFGLVTAENFDADPEDDGIAISIAPEDANGNLVKAPGILRTFIYENTGTYLEPKRGRELLSGVIYISENHYELFSTTDLRFEIPKNLSKSMNKYGILVVEFTTEWTSSGTSETFEDEYGWRIEIPHYSEEEKQEIHEGAYERASIEINDTKRKGNFEVTLERVGLYTKTGNVEEDLYYRVDLEVKNIDSDKQYFSKSDVTLIDNFGEQYDSSLLDGTFESGYLFPGVKRQGYILFYIDEEWGENVTVIVEVGRDYYFHELFLTFDVDLTQIFDDS